MLLTQGMSNNLKFIKDKSQTLLRSQLGAVSFGYVLIIEGVSVAVVGLLAGGGDAIMKDLLIHGLCEQLDDMIPSGTQWPCEHGGTAFWGW